MLGMDARSKTRPGASRHRCSVVTPPKLQGGAGGAADLYRRPTTTSGGNDREGDDVLGIARRQSSTNDGPVVATKMRRADLSSQCLQAGRGWRRHAATSEVPVRHQMMLRAHDGRDVGVPDVLLTDFPYGHSAGLIQARQHAASLSAGAPRSGGGGLKDRIITFADAFVIYDEVLSLPCSLRH